jgi:hypothetical protein
MQNLALPVLDDLALPHLAGDDLDPMYRIGWIATAHDGVANSRKRLRRPALNDALFRCRRQCDVHEDTDA